jgi:transcription initiation factor TFIIF subunit alpha
VLTLENYSNDIYQMAAYQKNRNPDQWLASRGGRKTQDPNAPAVKVEENANPHIMQTASLVYEFGQSAGPGGRQLRTVNKGSLFGDDDDDEESKFANRRREKELGGEGDADEVDFEEDFADDDEKYPEDNQDDEEAKELEVRFLDRSDRVCLTGKNTGTDKEGVPQSEGDRER